MSFADKTLTCRDCGMEFVFTAGEQEFYASKGFVNEPTRCPACRQSRKAAMSNSEGMGGMRSSSSRGGGNDYSAPRERVAHKTVCANCGQETTVPFIPRGHRPVYCSDCFDQMRGDSRSSASKPGNSRY